MKTKLLKKLRKPLQIHINRIWKSFSFKVGNKTYDCLSETTLIISYWKVLEPKINNLKKLRIWKKI